VGDDYAVIVLAGGAGSRLGGVDKPALRVGARSLLDRVLTAVADAAEIVVVGPPRPTETPVRWTIETPPGSGPVSALAAGLAALDQDRDVALLAGDSIGLRADTVSRLRAELAGRPGADGVLLCDAGGHVQWLIGVWRAAALRAAMPAEPANRGLGRVLSALTVVPLPERAGESADVDTPEDLRAARRRVTE
jgi:molybdopterin-guanine dinucleotide biosynthesis protein A